MTVSNCIREIRKIDDAIDMIDKYNAGEIPIIPKQHLDEIKELLGSYMDIIYKMKIVT